MTRGRCPSSRGPGGSSCPRRCPRRSGAGPAAPGQRKRALASRRHPAAEHTGAPVSSAPLQRGGWAGNGPEERTRRAHQQLAELTGTIPPRVTFQRLRQLQKTNSPGRAISCQRSAPPPGWEGGGPGWAPSRRCHPARTPWAKATPPAASRAPRSGAGKAPQRERGGTVRLPRDAVVVAGGRGGAREEEPIPKPSLGVPGQGQESLSGTLRKSR